MSAGKVLLWIIFPYVAITVFVVGHWWRYRRDQFSWTSRSTQLLDRRVLGWASPAFHYGALAAVGGHIVGLCIPHAVTDSVGITENTYRWASAVAGGGAGVVTLAGFLGLVYRRATSDRVRRSTTRLDIATYLLLTLLIVIGCWLTFDHNLATSHPYNYRDSIAVWWQSIFYLHPNVAAIQHAPLIYQLHAIIAWGFWGLYPFSRLVHAWSIPVQYLGRPYILYRRRYSTIRGRRLSDQTAGPPHARLSCAGCATSRGAGTADAPPSARDHEVALRANAPARRSLRPASSAGAGILRTRTRGR